MSNKGYIIDQEIKRLKSEIARLEALKKVIDINRPILDKCPMCGTKNFHWNLDNSWTCAFC